MLPLLGSFRRSLRTSHWFDDGTSWLPNSPASQCTLCGSPPNINRRSIRGWKSNPVSGCLLLDPLGATAQAYGVEFGSVIVNANGRIAGFTFALPDERQIKAVQEGSAIAIKVDADNFQMDAILAGRAVRLDSEPHRMQVPEGKPDIPPSPEVRISPSKTNGTEETQGPDWWFSAASISRP